MQTKGFRLAPLLKIRENLRDSRRKELAQIQAEKNNLLLQIQNNDVEAEENSRAWRKAQMTPHPDLRRLDRYQVRQQRLAEQKKVFIQQLDEITQQETEAQTRLDEAVRDVRVLENLRDRQTEQQKDEEAKREQNRLDAIGIQGANRKTE